MGTKLQSESYLPGYSMRDLNEDPNICSWPHYYGGKTLTNGQYCNSFISRAIVDAYPRYDKDVLKRMMLEHDDLFRNQVSELHRLYRIQRELMDEIKKRDLQKNRIPIEPSLSSSLLASQITSEDAHKWHIPSFPLANYLCGRPLVSGVKGHSPLGSMMGSSAQASPFTSQIGDNSQDVEVLECRPTKVRRKMFDLQLPAEEYIDTEEAEQFKEDTTSGTSSYLPNRYGKIETASGGKLFHEGKTDCLEHTSRSDSCSRGKNSLADLNEHPQIEETNASAYSHFLGHDPYHGGRDLSAKPKQELLGLPKGISMNFLCQSDTKSVSNVHVQKNGTTRGFFSHVLEAGNRESNSKSISKCFQPQKLPLSLQQDVKSVSYSNNNDRSRSEISERLHSKKILGIPIFEKHYVPKNECSISAPYASVPQPSEGEGKTKGRHMLLDINLPCGGTFADMNQDVAENSAIEKEATNLSSIRHQFDLNSCVDEDEASFIPSVPSTTLKAFRGIDLEAPLIPEPEDVTHGEELLGKACESPLQSAQIKDDCIKDELVNIAAETIVAISSYGKDGNSDDIICNSSEKTMTDPLNWFVETISSFGEDLERKVEALSSDKDRDQNESSSEEIDYFESMILNLAETPEEDYMPEPLVPENFEVEETGATSLLTTRTRKSQGRRGRQRRDFQRDILPGISSLSRHEVTEDLQTFGGLMRATGYSWQSGVTRRNSTRNRCGRGKRWSVISSPPASVAATTCMPLMQQLNSVGIGLEDRSLTGWGKTTRRPRRQRCPTGNPPSLALN